jgi:hypothetical protein
MTQWSWMEGMMAYPEPSDPRVKSMPTGATGQKKTAWTGQKLVSNDHRFLTVLQAPSTKHHNRIQKKVLPCSLSVRIHF